MNRTMIAMLVGLPVCLASTGCFVGTPKEEIEDLGGKIEFLRPGEIKLSLADTRVSDFDMHAVTALCSNHSEYTTIRALDLSDTHITDEALEILSELETLEELNLANTQVTEAGIRKFEAAVPDCHILRE